MISACEYPRRAFFRVFGYPGSRRGKSRRCMILMISKHRYVRFSFRCSGQVSKRRHLPDAFLLPMTIEKLGKTRTSQVSGCGQDGICLLHRRGVMIVTASGENAFIYCDEVSESILYNLTCKGGEIDGA